MVIEFPNKSRMRELVAARIPHAKALFNAAVIAKMNGADGASDLYDAAMKALDELSPEERESVFPSSAPTNYLPAALAAVELGKEVVKIIRKK